MTIIILVTPLYIYDKCFLICSIWHGILHHQNWTRYHKKNRRCWTSQPITLVVPFVRERAHFLSEPRISMMRLQFIIVTFINGWIQSWKWAGVRVVSQDTIWYSTLDICSATRKEKYYRKDIGRFWRRIWFWKPKSWSFWHGRYTMGNHSIKNIKVVCKAILNEFCECKTKKWQALR